MISKALKYARLYNNSTQIEVSKATGISQPALSSYENGIKIPTVDKCIILADYYGITVDELIGHEVKKNW